MKKYILPTLAGLTAALSLSAQTADPVLMTIDSKPVLVSEFEYLYNKNNTQQSEPQPLQEYLDMFITYKLKVADAEAAGIQNTPEFKEEFETFRRDLSKPYFHDQATEDSLVNLSYSHYLEDVVVSHIMFPMDEKGHQRADSVRNAILAGTITFEDAAKQFSIDGYSADKGGMMGMVVPNQFPWAFEEVAYATPVHVVSEPVNSGVGYHLVRPESRNPASGEVNASHILIMTRGLAPEEKAKRKATADSLYNVLMDGADFAVLASQYSEDPGSAKNGGNLGYFPHGRMVAEFDSTAFALADGQISQPVETVFGYHIIRRNGYRNVRPFDEMRPEIIEFMKRDQRGQMPVQVAVDRVVNTLHGKVNEATMQQVAAAIEANENVFDAALAEKLAAMNLEAASYANVSIPLSEVLAAATLPDGVKGSAAVNMIRSAANNKMTEGALDYEREAMMKTIPEYRNLVNEYRDGILLYEISNRNVWNRAAKDSEGLKAYFDRNRANYKWDKPRYKATIIFSNNDSILNEAMQYAPTVQAADPAEFATEMRKKFGRNVKIERVVAAEGENAITDYLGFNHKKPELNTAGRWPYYAAFKAALLDAPEEPSDLRGTVVTDYQNELEKEWVEQLHKTHKVDVNKKVLKQLEKNKK